MTKISTNQQKNQHNLWTNKSQHRKYQSVLNINRCLISLILREMQIKKKSNTIFHLSTWQRSKVGLLARCGRKGTHIFLVGIALQLLWKAIWQYQYYKCMYLLIQKLLAGIYLTDKLAYTGKVAFVQDYSL